MTKTETNLSVKATSLSTGLMIGILIVVGTVVFLPTLKCEFIFDDRALVANNPLLRGAGGVKEVLTSGRTLRMPRLDEAMSYYTKILL